MHKLYNQCSAQNSTYSRVKLIEDEETANGNPPQRFYYKKEPALIRVLWFANAIKKDVCFSNIIQVLVKFVQFNFAENERVYFEKINFSANIAFRKIIVMSNARVFKNVPTLRLHRRGKNIYIIFKTCSLHTLSNQMCSQKNIWSRFFSVYEETVRIYEGYL